MTSIINQNKTGQEISDNGIIDRARGYARRSTAENTRTAYQFDLDAWAAWCESQGLDVDNINEGTVSLYATSMAGQFANATIERRIAGLNAYCRAGGNDGVSFRVEPLKSVWAGIKRTHGKPQNQKAPITTKLLRDIIASIDVTTTKGVRDRALMVLGFAGAMRRSDIVGLDFGPEQGGYGFVKFQSEGLLINFTRSKTNQTGEKESIGIAYGSNPDTCPVRTLQAWQAVAGGENASGAIFRKVNRHGHIGPERVRADSLGRIIKAIMKRHLVEQGESLESVKATIANYSGHSLRAGFVTSAFERGIPEADIMPHTRHKKSDTLYKYRRMATVFQNNPSGMVGL